MVADLHDNIQKLSEKAAPSEKYNVVFVLGPPGSGKGTQCQRIEETYGYVHLSAGDLLREERQRKGSEYGELIEQHICEGKIVPVEITCKLIENAMLARSVSANGFLIDGFPRNQDNLDGWDKQMADKAVVLFVLVLQAPIEVCVERCMNRGQNRSDDNEESMRKRIVVYNEQTLPIINHFRALNLVEEVDGSRTPPEVSADVHRAFQSFGIAERTTSDLSNCSSKEC
uniref:UMP-CMP kinase n=3 Tax=Meloidogyne TaxID=189290 RepID=A0A6V7WHK8_MELEN|nr:unnamed protein product [Meloidogyne enterolobii]